MKDILVSKTVLVRNFLLSIRRDDIIKYLVGKMKKIRRKML